MSINQDRESLILKIKELIELYEKRENDAHRPPYEQEAYGVVAYSLRKIIEVKS